MGFPATRAAMPEAGTAPAAVAVPPEVRPAQPSGAVRVGRNFLYRSVAQTISALINVVGMVLLGRALAADGYGRYAYYYALIPLVASLTEMGIGIIAAREIAREPTRGPRILGDALAIRAVTAGLVLAVALLVAPRLPGAQQIGLLLVVTVAALLDFSQDLSVWALRAHERLDLEARLLMTSQVLWVGLIAAGVAMGSSLEFLLGAAAVAYAVRMAVGFWIVRRHFYVPSVRPDLSRVRALIAEGLPFGIAIFVVTLYGRVGLLMLNALATPRDVSWFQVGYLLSQPFAFFATALSMALFPELSRRALEEGHKSVRSGLRVAVRYQFLMAFPLALGLVLLADPLIALFFNGRGFERAPEALRLLSLGMGLIFLNHLARYVLTALGRQRAFLHAILVGLAANLALCWWLIPPLGFRGASLAFLGAELATFVVVQRALASEISLSQVLSEAVKPLVAAVAGALWALALGTLPLGVIAAAAGVTYVFVLWMLRAVSEQEVRVLRRVVLSFTAPRSATGPAGGAS